MSLITTLLDRYAGAKWRAALIVLAGAATGVLEILHAVDDAVPTAHGPIARAIAIITAGLVFVGRFTAVGDQMPKPPPLP